jgi:hypothetical protein
MAYNLAFSVDSLSKTKNTTMKKIIVMLAVLFAIGVKQANAQRVTFYYYPTPNVYYNVSSHDYVYYDAGTSSWMTVRALPRGIVLTRSPRYTVYYNGTEVWKDNGLHKGKYKAKKIIPAKPIKKNKAKGRS